MIELDFVRIFLAFFVGYFLTVSGSLSQLVTQNNLASPSTLGFDGLAVISIILAQLTLTVFEIRFQIDFLSFCLFALFFLFLFIYRVSTSTKENFILKRNIEFIILLGLGFNLFVGAIFSVIQFLFIALNWDFPTGIWFGNFKYYSEGVLWLYIAVFIMLQVILVKLAPGFRLLSIGSDFAQGVGVNVRQIQSSALFVSLFLTGLVISFFGVFSFLGLIFPHLLRLVGWFKRDMRNELLYGGIFTGGLFSGLDFICYRFDIYGTELPVGMVSSVFGSFILLILLVRKQITRKY